MEAATYASLAEMLSPGWRLIALDQRGHGYSSHTSSYSRSDYLSDLVVFFDHLHINEAVMLGNSLGGVNAYQFAAAHPDIVRGLIIEDIGAVVAADMSFVLPWAGTFPTREALEERIGQRFLPYLADSLRNTSAGWRLPFDPVDILSSQNHLNGDYWNDWLASRCPALLIRGRQSRLTTQEHFEKMVERRSNTHLATLDGGHIVHVDNPAGFANSVKNFLSNF
jgi:pimeloyl-ACP methyl ester carboxylesterase